MFTSAQFRIFVILFFAPFSAFANVASDLLTKPAEFVAFLNSQRMNPGAALAQAGSRSRVVSALLPDPHSVQGDVREAQNRGSFDYLASIKRREQSAGNGCVSKNNVFLSEIPIASLFPIVIGDLKTFGEEKEDNQSNYAAFGGDAASGDKGYFGYTRPVGGKEAWYGLWSDVGLYVGFWEPLAIAESVEQAFCFPGSQLMGEVLSSVGGAADTVLNRYGAPDGGDWNGAGFLYSHWYVTPEMTLLFGVLSDLGLRCATTGTANVFGNGMQGAKGMPFVYMSELDPSWESDSLAMLNSVDLENQYHLLYHVATAVLPMLSEPMCKVDCQFANGQNKEGELEQTYGKSGLLYRHCAGCQGYLYPLSGHTRLTGRNAAHLIVQRMMTKLSLWNVWGRLETASGKPAMCKACAGPSGQDRIGETYVLKEGVFKGFLKKSDYKLMMLSPQNEKDRPCVDDANTSDKGRCDAKRYFVPLGRTVDAREKDLLLKKSDSSSSTSSGASGSGGTGSGSGNSSFGTNPDPARVAACLQSTFASSGSSPSGGSPQQNSSDAVPAIPADWVQNGPPDNTQVFTESGRLIATFRRDFGVNRERRWILDGLNIEERDFHRLNPPLDSGAVLYTVVPGRPASTGQLDGRSPAYRWFSGNMQLSPYLILNGQSQQVSGAAGRSVGDIVNSLAGCTGVNLQAVAADLLGAFVENFSTGASEAAQGSAVTEAADVAKIVQSWLKVIAPFVGLGGARGPVSGVPVAPSPVVRNSGEAGLAMQDQKNATQQSMKVEILRPNFAFAVTRKRNCCDPLAPFPFDHATGNANDSHDLPTKTLMMSTGVITAPFNNCQLFNPFVIAAYATEVSLGLDPKFNWEYLDSWRRLGTPHCVLSLTKSCSREAETVLQTRSLVDLLLNSTGKNIELMEAN